MITARNLHLGLQWSQNLYVVLYSAVNLRCRNSMDDSYGQTIDMIIYHNWPLSLNPFLSIGRIYHGISYAGGDAVIITACRLGA